MRKVEQRMTDAERAEHDAHGDRIAYIPAGGVKVHTGDKESLDYLWLGMLLRKVVAFEYQEARGRVQRGCLAPLGMVVYKNGLYVFGRRIEKPDDGKTIDIEPGSHESIVRLAVERFTDVELHRLCGFNLPPSMNQPTRPCLPRPQCVELGALKGTRASSSRRSRWSRT